MQKGNLNATMTKQEVEALIKVYLDPVANQVNSINKVLAQHSRTILDIEEEYPLLPPEAEDFSVAVRKKGVEVMGGKKSPAYKDTDLRKKIFMDIYYQVKREYGLIDEKGAQLSYKKLKRKYLKNAMQIVNTYNLPATLEDEVTALNDLEDMEE